MAFASPAFAAISQTQFQHLYAGNSLAYGSANTAGCLLIAKTSQSGNTNITISDTNGNTWVALPQLNFQSNTDAMRLFYVLSANAGANTVSVFGGSDQGITIAEYCEAGSTWQVDASLTNGSSFDGSTTGATTSPRTNAWSTSGSNDVIFMSYADENNTQATHTTSPAGFVEQQWDNSHVDGDAVWLNASAQTSIQSGWDVSTSMSTYGLYVAAFTATGSATPTNGTMLTFE